MLVSFSKVLVLSWFISSDINFPLMQTYPLFSSASDTISSSRRPTGCDQTGIWWIWNCYWVSRKWTTFTEEDQTRGKHKMFLVGILRCLISAVCNTTTFHISFSYKTQSRGTPRLLACDLSFGKRSHFYLLHVWTENMLERTKEREGSSFLVYSDKNHWYINK